MGMTDDDGIMAAGNGVQHFGIWGYWADFFAWSSAKNILRRIYVE